MQKPPKIILLLFALTGVVRPFEILIFRDNEVEKFVMKSEGS